MFSIRMRKIDNISVRQTHRWKARFVRFFADIFGFTIQVGVYGTFAKQKHLLCQHSIPSSKIPARAAMTGLAAAATCIPYLL